MAEQNEAYDRLIKILEELFQLDQADLDFGIYRIMNQKREEVSDFLENKLLSQIEGTLKAHADDDKDKLEEKLENLEATLRDAGVDVDSNAKILTLRKQLAKTDVTDLQNNVFSHLTNFFKRYYKQGDFISQRRYKDDAYAIPYQGEEVKLHWANHDQYYIKTSEYFKNYRFKLRNDQWVNFELREASTEQNNNKAQNGERKFKLAEDNIYSEDENTLTIYFTYAPMSKKKKQKTLRKQAVETLKDQLPSKWLTELLQPNPTEKNKDRTELEKHLKDYTARNTFDYFIHKDLGKFLRRELDFYIKNEILHIDDIDLDNQESYHQSLQVIKAFKKVGLKIIDFLAQLENFQKKLWLKKKFVLQSDYCITLDQIDEAFYATIAENEPQRKEWIELFTIDALDGYTEPLSVNFLKENPFLMVDTRFFDKEWKYKLLATFDNLDNQTDGFMINSENFQALNFLKNRYSNQVSCIYIDPPYNTDSTPIIYKNGYKHGSWLSLINDRLLLAQELQTEDSIVSTAIDHAELFNLGRLQDDVYGEENRIAIVTIQHNPKGRNQAKFFSENSDYMLVYANDKHQADFNQVAIDEEVLETFNQEDEKGRFRWENFIRARTSWSKKNKPNNWYPLYVSEDLSHVTAEPKEDYHEINPVTDQGEYTWKNIRDSFIDQNNGDYFKAVRQNGSIQILHKYREQQVFKNVWIKKKYQSEFNGTNLLKDIFGNSRFDYPKSLYTTKDIVKMVAAKESYTLDYFAGSGTTGHAVIELNREEDWGRKYIMVEMGEYFDSVTKPRIQKVVYSNNWKDGRPEDREGISHMFKYLRLESYEDTLNNLNLQQSGRQQELLKDEELNEEYMLHYMLDVEARDRLLTTEVFTKPFGYTIAATEHNERNETEVDLVETFNYLIGLQVERIELNQGYVVVVGQNNDGEQILVIWRNLEKHDNTALEEFFRTLDLATDKKKLDRIYVNGDNTLRAIRTDGETWNVQLIEEEFHKRMFEKKGL